MQGKPWTWGYWALVVFPLFFTFYFVPTMPAPIPGLQFHQDDEALWQLLKYGVFALPVANAVWTSVLWLIRKRSRGTNPGYYLLLVLVLSWIVLLDTVVLPHIRTEPGLFRLFDRNLVAPLLTLAMVFIGTILPGLPPNKWAGIRVPWTLNNKEIWKRTRNATGFFMVFVGLHFFTISLFMPYWQGMLHFLIYGVCAAVYGLSYSLSIRKQYGTGE